MPKRIVTIHQPDFMPWLGFFVKVARADIFIVLDHVRNNPKTGTWLKRVRLANQGAPFWFTIPLVRSGENVFERIADIRISDKETTIIQKNVRRTRAGYARAPHSKEYMTLIDDYFSSPVHLLSQRNMNFIRSVMDVLHITTEIIHSSDMGTEMTGNEQNADLVRQAGGDVYLSGDGAGGYQDEAAFQVRGIELLYNSFANHPYKQVCSDEFLPGLSILDALMNVGAAETRKLIENCSVPQ